MSWLRSLGPAGIALALGMASAVAQSGDDIGLVFQEQYNGALGQLVDTERELHFTDPVYHDEQIRTGPDSTTAVQFLDATRLQVGANSTVVLDRFIFDPDQGVGDAVISFGTGVFRFVTGQMANKDGFELRTPTAVMAIRGTKLIVSVGPNGETHVSVIEGSIEISPCVGPPVLVEEGYSAIIDETCAVTIIAGIIPYDDEFVMTDLPALGDIIPAAGPTAPTAPVNTGPPAGNRGNFASPS